MANGNQALARMISEALVRHDVIGEDDLFDDIEGDYDDDEIGRKRRGRRALAAIFTGGGSEIRRHRQRNQAQRRERSEERQVQEALQPTLEERIAAAQAAQAAERARIGFNPSGDYRGVLGIPNVLVPAAGGFQQARAVAEEPTQLSRLSFTCWDPAGVIGPQDAICYMGVTNIRIGTQSIFSTTTPASLDSLGSRATYAMVMTRTLSTGQSLTVDYVNDHPTAQLRVRGTGFGPTPQG